MKKTILFILLVTLVKCTGVAYSVGNDAVEEANKKDTTNCNLMFLLDSSNPLIPLIGNNDLCKFSLLSSFLKPPTPAYIEPPSALTYTGSPYTFEKGTAITTLTPTVKGNVTSCDADPYLPKGLFLSATTCAIGGTPTENQLETSHTITASNSKDKTTAIIRIAVGTTSTMRNSSILLANTGSTEVGGSVNSGLVVDAFGNVYTSGSAYDRKVFKISPLGVVSTFAGSGSYGSMDGTGTAASFSWPGGLAIDSTGNIYVADGNSIRKITSSRVVSTFAGSTTSGNTEGIGTSARFNNVSSVAFDYSGNLYVTDSGNFKIRKITASGLVTTFAGSGSQGSLDGTGSAASFNAPTGIAIHSSGNIYVVDMGYDWYNYKLRKISSTGVVTTIVNAIGSGTNYSNPYPSGLATLAIDSDGNLYANMINQGLYKISPTGIFASYDETRSGGGVGVDTLGNLYYGGMPTVYKLQNSTSVLFNPNFGNGYCYDACSTPTINYLSSYNIFTRNISITPLAPTLTGSPTSCSSSPTLPTGLSISNTTCTISGMPTVSQVATVYTITATNSNGYISTKVSIAIQ
ncbi:MAG TPA: putative Ig domain-containing protein [Leptospiraceae bacterium]|nr:putative Ig domain-containing protein [Leptospiraceae bacterium]